MSERKIKKEHPLRNFIAILILIVMATYVGLNLDTMDTLPWTKGVEGMNFSGFVIGEDGACYAIDQGGIRVLAFDENGVFKWEKTFDTTVRSVEIADNSDLYVAAYDFTDANMIRYVEIERFSADGEHIETLYKHTYWSAEMPVYNAGFLGLRYDGGRLHFVQKDADGLSLCSMPATSQGGNAEISVHAEYPYENAAKYVLTAAPDIKTGGVYFADKYGRVFRASEDGNHEALPYPEPPEPPAFSVPFYMTVADGRLYVSDIGLNTIFAYEGGEFTVAVDMNQVEIMAETGMLTYRMQRVGESSVALVNAGFAFVMDKDGALVEMPYTFEYDTLARVKLWTWWGALAIIALSVLAFALRALYRAYRRMGAERLFTNVLIVLLVIIITGFIIFRYSQSTDIRFTDTTIDHLSAMATLTAQLIDGDKLETIDSLDDYDSEDYREFERILAPAAGSGQYDRLMYPDIHATVTDEGTEHLVSWDEGVYRMLVRVLDGRVCYVYSSEDQYGSIYPWDYPYLDTEFEYAFTTGQPASFVNVQDETGEYTYTNMPIKNSAGEVVGVLEMGINQRAYRQEVNELMRDIAISVVVVVLVVLLLLREIMYFLQLIGQRRPARAGGLADVGTVRPLIFLVYFLDCLALVISPLFAMRLYSVNLGVSMEIGVALATSATFLFVGVASVAGARMSRKTGLYPLLIAGVLLLISGEIVALSAQNLWMFIVAKAIVGFGAGLLLNIADTFVAMQPEAEMVERGFSLSNVGMNAGTNCGVIIGGAIGAMWGYRSVYAAGAAIGLILLLYAIFMFKTSNMPDVSRTTGEKKGIATPRFLFSRGTLAFFLLMAAPYLIVGAFVTYFLPIQGSAEGLTEETLSRLVFVYGMVSIYIGPVLMHTLVKRLGSKWTLVLSGALLAGALAVYSLNPTLSMLVVGVIVFAVADSFSFPTQNLYYTQLPEVERYGKGAALGVTNIVNGLAQAASSYAFAFVLIFGVAKGLMLMAAALGLFMVLFALIGRRTRKGE